MTRLAPEDIRLKTRGTPAALWVLIGLVVLLIVAVVGTGILGRHRIAVELAHTTAAAAVPKVAVVTPKAGPATRALDLPGELAAWFEAPIYGQVSGYVRAWYTDYGAHVTKGEALATIDTPYLDEQLDKARANLAVAQARYNVAEVTARRWQALIPSQSVSQQSADENIAEAAARKAELDAAEHNVKRFEALEAFKTIAAPFDGIVTARRTDVGDYVDARGATGAASDAGATETRPAALFRVADVHAMRVFVSVPQDYAAALKPGVTATFSIAQDPGRTFQAKFSTTAKAFDTTSRTVITELTVDNADGALWPGTFVTVHFSLPAPQGVLVIPEQALLFRADGLLVCLVGEDGHVHLQKVQAGRNLGKEVQIVAGLHPGDRVVANPSEGLLEGEAVQVVAPKDKAGKEAS